MLQCCFVSCMILKLWFDLDFGIQKVDLGLPSYIEKEILPRCLVTFWLLEVSRAYDELQQLLSTSSDKYLHDNNRKI